MERRIKFELTTPPNILLFFTFSKEIIPFFSILYRINMFYDIRKELEEKTRDILFPPKRAVNLPLLRFGEKRKGNEILEKNEPLLYQIKQCEQIVNGIRFYS